MAQGFLAYSEWAGRLIAILTGESMLAGGWSAEMTTSLSQRQ
jgi:hypothetical protein